MKRNASQGRLEHRSPALTSCQAPLAKGATERDKQHVCRPGAVTQACLACKARQDTTTRNDYEGGTTWTNPTELHPKDNARATGAWMRTPVNRRVMEATMSGEPAHRNTAWHLCQPMGLNTNHFPSASQAPPSTTRPPPHTSRGHDELTRRRWPRCKGLASLGRQRLPEAQPNDFPHGALAAVQVSWRVAARACADLYTALHSAPDPCSRCHASKACSPSSTLNGGSPSMPPSCADPCRARKPGGVCRRDETLGDTALTTVYNEWWSVGRSPA